MPKHKGRLYEGKPSAKPFKVRLRETLDDGIFYDDCEDINKETFNEDWVCCPICLGKIYLEDRGGEEVFVIYHESMKSFYQ
jgi:hypothetical protein